VTKSLNLTGTVSCITTRTVSITIVAIGTAMAACVTVVLVTAVTSVTTVGTVTTIVAVVDTVRAHSTIGVLGSVGISLEATMNETMTTMSDAMTTMRDTMMSVGVSMMTVLGVGVNMVTMAIVDDHNFLGVDVIGLANCVVVVRNAKGVGGAGNRFHICGMTSVPFVLLRLLLDCNNIVFMRMSSVIVVAVCVTASTNIGVTVSTVVSVSVFTVDIVVMTAMSIS